MAEGSLTSIIRKMVFKAEPYLPQVPKPKKENPITYSIVMVWCCITYLHGNGTDSVIWSNSS